MPKKLQAHAGRLLALAAIGVLIATPTHGRWKLLE